VCISTRDVRNVTAAPEKKIATSDNVTVVELTDAAERPDRLHQNDPTHT
jgi:hypothetical protein